MGSDGLKVPCSLSKPLTLALTLSSAEGCIWEQQTIALALASFTGQHLHEHRDHSHGERKNGFPFIQCTSNTLDRMMLTHTHTHTHAHTHSLGASHFQQQFSDDQRNQ